MSLECSNRAAIQKKRAWRRGECLIRRKNLLDYRKKDSDPKKNKQFCLVGTPFELNWTIKKRDVQLNQAAKNVRSSNNRCLLNRHFSLFETAYVDRIYCCMHCKVKARNRSWMVLTKRKNESLRMSILSVNSRTKTLASLKLYYYWGTQETAVDSFLKDYLKLILTRA